MWLAKINFVHIWKWRLKETGGIDVFKCQSKLKGSMDGTSWELVAWSQEGWAEGDILAANVSLNGAVVTISFYLKLIFNSIFKLFETLFRKQDTYGKGWLAALSSNTLSLSLGTVSPSTFHGLPCTGSHPLPSSHGDDQALQQGMMLQQEASGRNHTLLSSGSWVICHLAWSLSCQSLLGHLCSFTVVSAPVKPFICLIHSLWKGAKLK